MSAVVCKLGNVMCYLWLSQCVGLGLGGKVSSGKDGLAVTHLVVKTFDLKTEKCLLAILGGRNSFVCYTLGPVL